MPKREIGWLKKKRFIFVFYVHVCSCKAFPSHSDPQRREWACGGEHRAKLGLMYASVLRLSSGNCRLIISPQDGSP